jgi:hippurate hydrolase
MMMDAGLFDRIPRPDKTLALHVASGFPAGQVGYTSGFTGANVDAVKITVHGRGGHGARPHETIDPIVTAAYLVTELQTLVSRRVDPLDPAVVTVGSIHGGHKNNVIPDEVELELSVRSYSDSVRKILMDGIRQLAEDTCRSFRCPKPPTIWVREFHTPAVYNDPELVAHALSVFRSVVGEENTIERKPSMGGDDFGRFGVVLGVPSLLYRLGAVDPEVYQTYRDHEAHGTDAPPLPSLHSSRFAPAARKTLETGLRTMSALLISLLPVE